MTGHTVDEAHGTGGLGGSDTHQASAQLSSGGSPFTYHHKRVDRRGNVITYEARGLVIAGLGAAGRWGDRAHRPARRGSQNQSHAPGDIRTELL